MKRSRGRPVGCRLSQESKDKIAAGRIGKHHSLETRMKIAHSLSDYFQTDLWPEMKIEAIVKIHMQKLRAFVNFHSKKGRTPNPLSMGVRRREALNIMLDLISDGMISYVSAENRVWIASSVLKAYNNSYEVPSQQTVRIQQQLEIVRLALNTRR